MANPQHLEVLKRSVTEWNEWRKNESFIPDLRAANLSYANLSYANLSYANLRYANLSAADLSYADLRYVNLSAADLSYADLSAADLRYADLRAADLRAANLREADLRYAGLRAADLRDADLRDANLRAADLSAAKELRTAVKYLEQFEKDEKGIIVYKGIGNTPYSMPHYWKIEAGAFLTEVVNPDRGTTCGCGVNFATREWIESEYPESDIWKCRIHWLDLADVVVPFNTDGKARCGRLELLGRVK